MNKLPCPSWARQWRVDEVIECLSFGNMRQKVTEELLAAMPDAYTNKRPPDRKDWKPGDEDARNEYPPEPDTADRYRQSLNHAWKKLSLEVQQAIVEAYRTTPLIDI
jgi:hypothetical protein